MRRILNLLSDPGLHLLALALFLVGLAIGASGGAPNSPTARP